MAGGHSQVSAVELAAPLRAALAVVRHRSRELPPVVAWYLVLIWSAFLLVAAVDFDGRRALADPFGYSIDDLSSNLPRALVVLPIAPFVNVGVLQILYVTAILAVAGPRAVERNGSATTSVVFFGTSIAAALLAGAGLYVADAHISHAILDEAWARSWNGGSAGCYGVLGMLAANARRPWVMLGSVAALEIVLALVYLQSYTPAFHLTALVTGFCMVRWLPWPLESR